MVHADHPAALIKRFLRQLIFGGIESVVIRDSVKSHCTYCRVMSFFNLKTDQTGRRCACFRTYGSPTVLQNNNKIMALLPTLTI